MRTRPALHRVFLTFSLAASVAVSFVACNGDNGGSGDPEDEATTGVGLECSPGEVLDCECNDGSMGTQVCLATGDEVGPCDCGGYMGYGGDTPVSVTQEFALSGTSSAPSVSVELTWHDAAGRPAPTDLDITIPDQADPVVQVFSSADGMPYVRSGLIVKELVVGRTYTASIAQDRVKIVGGDGGVVLEAIVDLPAFDEIALTSPEPSIFAAPVIVGAIREH